MEKVIASLQRVQIFNNLDVEELQQIADICQAWRVAAEHVVFREGDDGDRLYVIQQGKARVSLSTRRPDGQVAQSTINMLYAGQSFGELVLLDGNTRSATVTTVEPTILLELKAHHFARLCEENPRIGYRVMRSLASDLAYKLRSSNLLLRGNIRWQHDELGHSV